ncbi:MAG: transcription repressor NadR [Clostridiales bacterium]|nr:transcription repressor NadR [Clostridiales bacterium]
MDGRTRRQQIIQELRQAKTPLSGSALAARMGVSRQVIVQDIALLRTEYPVLATARGYLLYAPSEVKCVRAFMVRHTHSQIQDELSTIISLGGRVLDVIIEHDVYGQLRADLNLASQADVDHFCRLLDQSSCGPLFPISDGIHLHTVEAPSDEILRRIEQKLKEKEYLLS